MNRSCVILVVLVSSACACCSRASEVSIGPMGINSAGLGLNGSGIAIGQVEPGRPGKINYDNAGNCCNDKIVPTDVFVQDRLASVNEGITPHAIWVAGVMISQQTSVAAPPPVRSPPIGVAQQADLFSAAIIDDNQPPTDFQEHTAVAAQYLATLSGVDISAINMSFGWELELGQTLDGNSLLTQFVDWSASAHDVLYVVAGNEPSQAPGGPVPTDNFNGITVAESKKAADGKYREITQGNDFSSDVDAVGARTSTDLVAPGFLMDVAGANGTQPLRGDSSGTSFSAPHVTGTVALLQQHAQDQIENVGGPRWTLDAQHHQVMKAVLLNSADKIQGIIGMERTVLKQNGTDTWLQSDANSNASIPLDIEMGAGHLNAKRALQQFAPGEYGPGTVPLIGWDFGGIDGNISPNK